VVCAAGAGNLLLNIGPKGDGSLPEPGVALLEAVGDWLGVNGASIHGTTRSPWLAHAYGVTTCTRSRLYLHCFSWPGDGEIRLGFLASRATDGRLLAGGDAVTVHQRDDVLTVRGLPAAAPDLIDTVIEVDLDGGRTRSRAHTCSGWATRATDRSARPPRDVVRPARP
jgi:alpha-L-fucosidase